MFHVKHESRLVDNNGLLSVGSEPKMMCFTPFIAFQLIVSYLPNIVPIYPSLHDGLL